MNNEMKLKDRLALLIGKEKPFSWAKRIGIPGPTFNRVWKKDGQLKSSHLQLVSEKTGASLDWLITGKGSMFLEEEKPREEEVYNKDRIPEPGPREPALAEASFKVSEALTMAAGVLESRTSYASALYLNIRHFDRAIQAETRLSRIESDYGSLKKEVDALRKEVADLRTRLDTEKKNEKEEESRRSVAK